MSKSFILYIHNDLSGDTNWKKIGKAMTPYSAVRSRQKNCSQKFYLNHIFFGDPEHINILEETFKKTCYRLSGTYLNKISGQTELFKMPEEEILIHLLDCENSSTFSIKHGSIAIPQNIPRFIISNKSLEFYIGDLIKLVEIQRRLTTIDIGTKKLYHIKIN